MDPSFSTRLETASINEVALKVRWEDLEPGPSGDYLKVVDTDAAGVTYAPVDLNDRACSRRTDASRPKAIRRSTNRWSMQSQ